MAERHFWEEIRGKEIHLRLLSNDLLENGKFSVTAVSIGASPEDVLKNASFERKSYTEYKPQSLLCALAGKIAGDGILAKEDPGVLVIVEEKSGSLSADDARYIEWLGRSKGERPRVVMLPEPGHHAEADGAQPHHLLDEKEERKLRAASFWKRQLRRLKALPAPITRDAALAAIPRTLIPVGFSLFLAFLRRDQVALGRVVGYIGLAFGFAVGFALLNQTVLNWFTFWSEFTRDAFQPQVRSLEKRAAAQGGGLKYLTGFLKFVSARGDVLIAGPLLGVGCSYLARLVLGPMGETASVLTLYGFFLVLANVVVGSIASGPYPQVIAHLRAVGMISNRASMYLGIVDTVRMELGRVADFGMQTLYNAIQLVLASVFWLLLLVVDRCYPRPDAQVLRRRSDIEAVRGLFEELRQRLAALRVPAARS